MTRSGRRDPERFWAVVLGDPAKVAPHLGEPDARYGPTDGRRLSIWIGDQAGRIRVAEDDSRVALVEGRPHDLAGTDPAAALLHSFGSHGAAAAHMLGGRFTAIVHDRHTHSLYCSRDPLGVQPLFFARRAGGLAVSPSPELLAYSAATPPGPDPLALAEWVVTSTTPASRTLFAGVERIPPGHTLIATDETLDVIRYWKPDITKSMDTVDPGEALRRFEMAFEGALARVANGGRCAVFLSGGIDSSLSAAVLAEHHRAHGLEPPLAISVKFPEPDADEEHRTREVAAALGLPHLVVPLDQAMGGEGIFSAGIESGKRSWYPDTNPWNSAYENLAREAAGEGCLTVISGEGGNDLLEAPWELSADLLRAGQFTELMRFSQAQAGYYGGRGRDYLRELLWRHGVAALARPFVHRALRAVAPGHLQRLREARADAALPDWALPNRALRSDVIAHRASRAVPIGWSDLHGRARRQFLDAPFNSIMLEGIYLASRRCGAESVSPYWDPELYRLVFALPARSLYYRDQAKGLSYASFARRVDHRLARQLKPAVFEETARSAYAAEEGRLLKELGGLPRLSALGVVAEPAALAALDQGMAGHGGRVHQCWQLLSTEAWLQARAF